MDWIGRYLVVALLFGALDAAWLGTMGPRLYRPQLGDLMRRKPHVPGALAFYLLYVAGIVFFAMRPALEDGRWQTALVHGALLGLVAYGTWDLTNLAVIREFPVLIVVADMIWGTVATGASAAGAYAICSRIDALA